MKTKTLVLGLMLMAVILGSVAIAEPGEGRRGGEARGPRDGRGGGEGFRGGPEGGMGRGDMSRALLGRLGDKLELTDEQKATIKTAMDGSKEKMQEAGKAVREAMQALNTAAEGGSEAEIIAAGKAVGDAFTDQALLKAAVKKQVDAVLTDEQKAELTELKAEMKERMQERKQRGQGQGRGKGRGQGEGRRRGPGNEDTY